MAMAIRVENQSKHDFECVGSWGTQLSGPSGTLVPAGREVEIGTIDIPNQLLNKNGNWGWWYVQDVLNKATIEFFAYADPGSHDHDWASAGLRANNSHNKNRIEGATPNPLPQYLDTRRDDSSFTLIIKPDWTDNPPAHIFNFGHYGCFYLPATDEQAAAHAYVKVVSFDGSQTVNFDCYGGTSTDNHPEDWIYPALSFVATEAQLRLARTICCFDPNDIRTNYGNKPNLSPVEPSGKLHLGDCSGIIYLHSGVCHQMANRICAAVTNLDVGDLADMAMYNDTHLIWKACGSPPPPVGPQPVWDLIYAAFSGQMTLTDAQLGQAGVDKNATYPVSLLFLPWEDYLAECKKLVAQTPS